MKMQLTKVSASRRLTVWGWLLILFVLTGFCYLYVRNIHSYLSVNKPVTSKIWVVEGHVEDFIIDSVTVNYHNKRCSVIFTTGIPIEKQLFCDRFSNYADLTAATLIARGCDSAHIHSAPCNPVQKDRSYTSALALKEELCHLGYNSGKINIVSQGTHARRTHVLFKKALGENWDVGIISYSDLSYDPKKWWTSSYGMRNVVYECLAYLYAVLFFHPNE